ncbi:hypothetical protein [Adlercreutzia sp. ZJ141]|uniref:hypothetical protein n=1 Tax=Adlercreutzia sp. ZJ141 TaxID=2709406 RepID=UPI0013ECC6C5|nr:hypothetical protein [Adlercreutzia sp. ZJ141]
MGTASLQVQRIKRYCSEASIRKRRFLRSDVLYIKIATVGWLILFNALIFHMALQDTYGAFAYIDESVAVLMLIIAVLRACSSTLCVINVNGRRAIACLVLYVVVGLIGNASGGIQTAILPICIDVFTFLKFCIVLYAAIVLFNGDRELLRLACVESRLLIVIVLACAVANLLFECGMSWGERYGLRSFKWLFNHPSVVNSVLVGLVVLLVSDVRKNRMWIYLALLVMCLTLRSVGIATAALVCISVELLDGKKHFGFGYLALVAGAVLYLGYDQIAYYYTMIGSARLELTRTSIDIANTYAPIGTGFATFGSNITANPEYYSSLYYQYGLSRVYGLALGSSSFLSDTFWPTVIAQGGWLGFLFFVAFIYFMFVSLIRKRGSISLSTICVFGYLIIATASASAFFHPTSVFIAFCLGLSWSGTLHAGLELVIQDTHQ